MKKLSALVFLGLGAVLPIFAFASLTDFPPMRLQPFERLQFPPQLPKEEVHWMIQSASDELYEKAFVDLGDTSDLMHAHILMKHEDPNASPENYLHYLNWIPPWEKLTPMGALFHAREHEAGRNMRPYLDRQGREVPAENRNQFLWLTNYGNYEKGDLVSAREIAPERYKKDYTIRPSDLNYISGPKTYEWEFSFYFFRIHCPDLDMLRKQGADVEKSNALEVMVGGERVCLALVSYYCQNNRHDLKYCPEKGNLRPYYSPEGPLKY